MQTSKLTSTCGSAQTRIRVDACMGYGTAGLPSSIGFNQAGQATATSAGKAPQQFIAVKLRSYHYTMGPEI